MLFEPQKIEAQLALNRIGTTDMPALAWKALEAGLDGPGIRRLAALEFPTFFEVQAVLPAAMKEMNLSPMSKAQAAVRLARLRAREILESSANPLGHLGEFYRLWREADYCRELQEYGNLDEYAYVTQYTGIPDAEVRAWVLERLTRLAEMKEGV